MAMSPTGAVEFRDIPVKFLGTGQIGRHVDDEQDIMGNFLIEKASKRKLQGFAKEMLLSFSPRGGWLSATPKAGGQTLHIELASITAIAVLSS